jgi:hypothetical protein
MVDYKGGKRVMRLFVNTTKDGLYTLGIADIKNIDAFCNV